MRIAIVRTWSLDGDGITRVVESWARVLGAAGHDVTVLSRAPSVRPFPELPGVRSLLYEAGRSTRHGTIARAAVRALGRHVRGEGADLVISHESLTSFGIRRSLGGLPLLQTFHSPFVDENRLNGWKYAASPARRAAYPLSLAWAFAVDRLALGAVDCAHTLSDFTWHLLRERYPGVCAGLRHERIAGSFDARRFVPPEDRSQAKRALGYDPDAVLLLTVRRLIPRTGADRILRCAIDLKASGRRVKFLIGGTGVLRRDLERGIREQGLSDSVELLGFIPEEELPAYYQAADAFLLPTRDLECFGMPVVEAMACGCTPLIAPGGGPSELCRDHPAWVAEENSTPAFSRLVARFAAGELPRADAYLAAEARRRFSEEAIREPVTRLVESLAHVR